MKLLERFSIRVWLRKRELLERYGWYPRLIGGWMHPHCMDWLTAREIWRMDIPRLEYALQHGSRARYSSECG